MQDNSGILLLAIGHPYYARMAYNLLVSIRYHDKHVPVAIAVAGNGFDMLDDYQKNGFDHVIRIQMDGDPYRHKLHLDEYTPFKRTLYLDVDMIFGPNKTPGELFEVLHGKEFQCIVRGRISEKSEWMDMGDVLQEYGFDQLYDISSEMMYFEGKPLVFKYARKIYSNPGIKIKQFGSGYPDEAFLTLAMETIRSIPETSELEKMECPFEPSYWEPRHFPNQHSQTKIQSYYLLSVGGAHITQHIKRIYDNLLDMYFYHSGMPGTGFQLQPKSRIFNERRLI